MDATKMVDTPEPILELRHVPEFRRVPDVPEDVFFQDHLNDPNFDFQDSRPLLTAAHPREKRAYDPDVDGESQFDSYRYSLSRIESRNSTAIEFDDESPYPEVRAAVASVDDPTMPVNTFRVWVLGILFAIVVPGFNQLFTLRFPSIFITGIVIQLIALPLGHGLAYILPKTRFNILGHSWSLNPGPFSIKEHVCITVMANIAVNGAYTTDVALTAKFFYKRPMSFGFQILLAISTQLTGFVYAGFLRPIVVWPSSMIWPGVLVNSALFNTLHKNYGKRDGNHMTRERFFCIVMLCSAVWYWVPGYLFTGLSFFTWICWVAPQNPTVNALFGGASGLGMSVLSFDWTMISFTGSPLITPWWSAMNTGVGLVVLFWFIAPIMYFTNAFNAAHFPVSSVMTFDNTGNPYIPENVITNGVFDEAKYQAYSPLFLSTSITLAYGIAFAVSVSVIVHTFLWFRKDIARRFRHGLNDETDIHSRLMQSYREVPLWWYGSLFAITFTMFLVAVGVYPSQFPIWAAFVCLIPSAILSLPLGILAALTNQQIGTQVIQEMIAGYMLPGRPIANMIFKAYGFMGTSQAVSFSSNLKLGHYMKVPPRMMFVSQIVAVILGCFSATLVQIWMFANVVDICQPTQRSGFTCPSSLAFASASVIWGGIGPRRLFSVGSPYSPIFLFFLAGGLLPIPFYMLARRYPMSIFRYVNIPIFFAGLGSWPPASGLNYGSWLLVCFIFNFVIRRYRFRWWMRYNYITSAALDAGAIIGMIVVFFAVQLPKGGITLSWWGNNVWMNTADANNVPVRPVPSGTTIGPSSWH